MATLSTTTAQLNGWQAGSICNDAWITTTNTLGGMWQDATATQQQAYQQYYMQIPQAWSSTMSSAIRKIKFWRINRVIEMDEGAKFEDPLDELRLKVARWLSPGEKYNLAT